MKGQGEALLVNVANEQPSFPSDITSQQSNAPGPDLVVHNKNAAKQSA